VRKRVFRSTGSAADGSSFLLIAVAVVCGLEKSQLISSIYPEQFELRRALVDGFKAKQNPESTNYR
jgi:hypothetical protein